MTIDLRSLLYKGHAALQAKHAEKERDKLGHPRVGSSGFVTDEGKVLGTCNRIAMARRMGIEKPADLASQRMWQAGFANEWSWETVLGAAGFDGEILTQDEVEVEIDGVAKPLLGHPDIKLLRKDGALTVVELKGIFGYTSFSAVFFDGKPKPANLAQLANYMLYLGADGILVYSSSSWMKLATQDYKKWVGQFRSVPPFDVIFNVRWNGDVLEYQDDRYTHWVPTQLTKHGILDYHRLVQEMMDKKDLGPRLTSSYADGTPHKYGEHAECGLCPFSAACDGLDDYDEWIEAIKQITEVK